MDAQSLIRMKVGSLDFEVSGREEFVEAQLQRFLSLLPPDALSQQLGNGAAAIDPPAVAVQPPGTNSPTASPAKDPPTLLDFYRERAPSTDVERVTVLAAYLRDSKGQDEVTEDSLHPLFRELAVLGQQPAKNITHGIWNAASKGRAYLERVDGKRGTYRLTNAGAALVYNTLPEQTKAKRRP
ncbi:MAG: hypothetical protein HYU30_02210 [Chloroflexi bacterium]|nr:hypothetical protein [Chloroflexota bacterium]